MSGHHILNKSAKRITLSYASMKEFRTEKIRNTKESAISALYFISSHFKSGISKLFRMQFYERSSRQQNYWRIPKPPGFFGRNFSRIWLLYCIVFSGLYQKIQYKNCPYLKIKQFEFLSFWVFIFGFPVLQTILQPDMYSVLW